MTSLTKMAWCIMAVALAHACTKSPTGFVPSPTLTPNPRSSTPADSIPASRDALPYIVNEMNDPYQTIQDESALLIQRTDPNHEETISLAFGQDGRLLQATEKRLLWGIDRNYVFTYDQSKQRIHSHWNYSFDQAGQINRIEFSSPGMSRLYLVSSKTLDLYRLIIRQLLPNGDIRQADTTTCKYTYNESGDPAYVDITYRSSLQGGVDYAYELNFTDINSPLTNDPANHFGNLNFWLDGIPMVSRHLPATMQIINSPMDFGWVDDMTDAERFSYVLDDKQRPVSITIESIGSYPILPKHYDVSYPK